MTTMIQQYVNAKRQHEECAAWAALIGDHYRGGGGGIGRLVSLQLMKGEASPNVYHQYSDGAKNYHHMPATLAPYLEDAIKARFGELLADALKRQSAVLERFADDAVKEHKTLLKAAGLDAGGL